MLKIKLNRQDKKSKLLTVDSSGNIDQVEKVKGV